MIVKWVKRGGSGGWRPRARLFMGVAAAGASLVVAAFASAHQSPTHAASEGDPGARHNPGTHYFDYLDAGSEVVPGGVSQISIGCSDDRPHVAGGGILSTFGSDAPRLVADSPSSGGDGWSALLSGTSASTTQFRVYGICSAVPVQTRSVSFGVPADGKAHTKTVSCRTGYQVISGGINNATAVTGATLERTIVQSYPVDGEDKDHTPDDGWRVTTRAAKKSGKPAEAYALCVKASKVQVIYEHLDFVASRHGSEGVYVDCHGLKEVTGGGVQLDQPKSGITVTNSAPFDSTNDSNSAPEDRWATTVDGPPHGHVDATNWAVCTKFK